MINANAGPFYNTSSSLVIDPSTPSTLYSVNPIRKSTDGGATWTRLPDPTVGGYVATALAVDPVNSNTVYLSTDHAMFKSPNGGQSWNAVSSMIPGARAFVFSPDLSTIYAAAAGGVYQSADAGTNWSETNTGLSVLSIRMLVGDPVNHATIYAGGDQGLFKSIDSGATWNSVRNLSGFRRLPALPPVFPLVETAEVYSLC